jgi:RNA-directed DNA polymerase
VFKAQLRVELPVKAHPWRSSKTPGINQTLSNADLKPEWLVSMRDGWIKLLYPK